MKRTFTLFAATLLLAVTPLFAQKPMDQASEKAVQITSGPNITNVTPTGATINWTTNSAGANHVRYRIAGSNDQWQSAYHAGGGTSHSLQLSGLQPGKTYEWQILTRDGDLRTAGQFQTPTSGTAPDVNATSTAPAAAPSTGSSSPNIAKVPLYRAQNGPNHIYSTNVSDQSSNGSKPEGVAGYVATSQVDGTVPLYRLTNAKGDNVLTTDPGERSMMAGHGYQDNGVVGYVASSQIAGTQPLYQLSTPDGATHFYTTGTSERDQVIGRGWKDEGISGYVWTQP
ncbi:MAG TPA: fibronectin type III domain-containing protein [Candidatus Angelobacter sp.]|nr:fibronectin type III domain-containing protein [Candidatus Angelobacter sp.]